MSFGIPLRKLWYDSRFSNCTRKKGKGKTDREGTKGARLIKGSSRLGRQSGNEGFWRRGKLKHRLSDHLMLGSRMDMSLQRTNAGKNQRKHAKERCQVETISFLVS